MKGAMIPENPVNAMFCLTFGIKRMDFYSLTLLIALFLIKPLPEQGQRRLT